jgi:hypothetical protein
MKFNFENLDEQTRQPMLDEVEFDIANERLYYSKRLNDTGVKLYAHLLKQAVTTGNEQTLATALKTYSCFKIQEEILTTSGIALAKVPGTTHQTLAEMEFNRFYIRALCVRAIENNQQLKIYRARDSNAPRMEAKVLIGREVDPKRILDELRKNIGFDRALGLPSGPNSGLTVKLVCREMNNQLSAMSLSAG